MRIKEYLSISKEKFYGTEKRKHLDLLKEGIAVIEGCDELFGLNGYDKKELYCKKRF